MRPLDPQKKQLEDEISQSIQSGVPIAPELMEYANSIFPSLQEPTAVPENDNNLEQKEDQDSGLRFQKTPEEMQQYRDKMREAYPGDISFAEPEQVENNELDPELKDYAYNIFPSLSQIVPRENPQASVEEEVVEEEVSETPEEMVAKVSPKKAQQNFKQAVAEVSPEIEPKPAPSRAVAKEEEDIDKLMKQAEEREKSAEMDLAVAKFRDAVIGAGGTGYKSDLSQYERAIKQSKKPITDYQTRLALIEARDQINDKKAKNDPQSEISKMLRKSLEDIGVNVTGFENVSYSQLEKIYPSLANAAATKVAGDARKIEAAAKKEEVAQNKLNRLDLQQQKNAIGHIDFSMRQLAKPYQEYEQGLSQIDSANAIIEKVKTGKITPGTADVTTLYTLVKGLDPNSAVREGEIALSRQAMSLWGRIYSGAKGSISGGDLLDAATRKSIQEILKAIQLTREKSFIRQKSALIEAGAGKGIDRAVLEGSIYPEIKSVKKSEEIRTKMINGVPVKYKKTDKGWEKL